MRPCLVKVRHIRLEYALELPLLQDQQVVQALLPYTPQKAFADGVGSWRVNRRFEQLEATGRRHSAETGSKLAVVITNQVLRLYWLLGSSVQKKRPFETAKELHPLLANTGGSVYNQTSSTADSCSNNNTLM